VAAVGPVRELVEAAEALADAATPAPRSTASRPG
jgi:hypothetical protein